MIPKRLIFIWLGSELPYYGKFCIDNFKKVNPEFEIMLIYEPNLDNIRNQDILDLLNIIKLNKLSFYYKIMHRKWGDKNLTSKYGFYTNISDALRFYVLNKYGGIYLDLDTFPVKPFDNFSLSHNHGFAVKYSIKRHDIFFVGMPSGCIENKYVFIDEKTFDWRFADTVFDMRYPEDIIKYTCKNYNSLRQDFLSCRWKYG